jgi:uroporphyrinogen decarboxylase
VKLNTRERFLAVMNFEPVNTLKWEFGYWASAVRRWYQEGLVQKVGLAASWPDGIGIHGGAAGWRQSRPLDYDVGDAVGLDEGLQRIPFNNFVYPQFDEEIIEEGPDWQLIRNEVGVIEKRRNDRTALSGFVRGPIANREDWEQFKAERLQPSLKGRLPANWDELKRGYQNRSFPLALGGTHGFFGTPRFLFGEVQVLTAFYDEPELMHDIINYLADFWLELYNQMLDLIEVDLILIWEDMCFNHGPLISPATFREFLLPAYQKLTSFIRSRGIRHIFVDTDGNIWKLLPLFIEGGVTGLYPFEASAGMNVAEVRRAFPDLQILGGISKMALAQGPAAIDAELQLKIPWMLQQGGYIPYVDHFVPPDVSWDNFLYYRQQLNSLIDTAHPE